MHFATFVFKNLIRRRFRSALTMVGIAVAVGAVVALVGISRGLDKSFIDLYQQHGVDIVVVRAGSTDNLTSAIDESLGVKIAALPGVKEVAPGLIDVVSFQEVDLFGVVVQGWPADCFMFGNVTVTAGRQLTPADTRGVILGELLAKNLGKKAGDKLDVVEDETFEVVGTFQSHSVYENGSMIMLLPSLQKLMDRQDQVTGFQIVARDSRNQAEIEKICQDVKQLAPALEAMVTNDFVTNNAKLRVVRGMAWLTSTIALVIGAIGMLNTMVMSVFERTQEIGILRAIGWRPARVVKMVLLESLILSLSGAIVGTCCAVALTRVLSQMPRANGLVAGDVSPTVIVQGLAIAVLVGLLGGAYPAIRAARLLPTEALRHE